MPSIIPSYVYSLFASVIVGTIIVCASGLVISNVRRQAEEQRLSTIANYITSESMKLLSSSPTANFTSTTRLNLPSSVGGQRYWVRIANDSSRAWVEIGFGTAVQPNGNRVNILSEVFASGTYISGSGAVSLRSYGNSTGKHLIIGVGY